MTLRYSASIPTGNQFFRFINLLVRWKGSVYKLVWKDLLLYLALYYILSFVYRFALPDAQKTRFEDFVMYISSWKAKTLPITFLLGFFVSQILSRWWVMFNAIPTMDSPAYHLNALIMTKVDPQGARRIRLTAMRYLNLAWILSVKKLSTLVRRRFRLPKQRLRQLQENPELRLKEELQLMNEDPEIKKHFPVMLTKSEISAIVQVAQVSESPQLYQPDWYIPLQWCARLLKKATMHGFVENERNYLALVGMLDAFECRLQKLYIYAQFNLPLVYSQVVIISVYSYIIMHVFDNQFLDSERAANRTLGPQYLFDYYVPVLGILELLFVMGWLKVALVLLNPLGSDDEDFPTSDLLDYNVRVSRFLAGNYSIVFPPKLREQPDSETRTDLNLPAAFNGVIDSDCDEEDTENPCILTMRLKSSARPPSPPPPPPAHPPPSHASRQMGFDLDNGGFLPENVTNIRSFTLQPSEL